MSGFDLSTKISCQLYIILATGSQNLDKLNRIDCRGWEGVPYQVLL